MAPKTIQNYHEQSNFKQMKKYMMMILGLFMVASVSACGNTVIGVGQDIQRMGESIMDEGIPIEQ